MLPLLQLTVLWADLNVEVCSFWISCILFNCKCWTCLHKQLMYLINFANNCVKCLQCVFPQNIQIVALCLVICQNTTTALLQLGFLFQLGCDSLQFTLYLENFLTNLKQNLTFALRSFFKRQFYGLLVHLNKGLQHLLNFADALANRIIDLS